MPTAGDQSHFSAAIVGASVHFALSSGKIRNESFDWIAQSLELFNETNSLKNVMSLLSCVLADNHSIYQYPTN